jgi:hypothetical protein
VIRRSWNLTVGGQFWVGGYYWGSPSYVSFFTDVCGLELSADIASRATAYRATAESVCWWWPHKDFVVACERPHTIALDPQGRIHSLSGPAVGWRGWGVYAVHGIRVPSWVIEDPARLTVEAIHAEDNAEVRRVMIELYGMSRYVRDAGFEVVDADMDPIGQPRRLLRKGDVLVVELTNSTEDADKTRRVYHVPCHPELRPLLSGDQLGAPQKLTALNAVAASYGFRGEEYRDGMQVET